ncbi:hypothetical protein C8F04DRAFT_1109815 [Mycena alexandri]|uniref:Uncharacterized protein n=1 Tax=Mycena alexandri TaxID=1745969 RepID=A0AAD6SQK9_9AGAR|nr:hypothetical protein C8F04DRAFT_1109815 [Mycena alexandri]
MSSKRVLAPTQSRTIRNDADTPLKIKTSRSFRWNLPVSESANLSRAEEDATLCYAPRSSESDLTTCASAPSPSDFKTKNFSLPSSLELFLPYLPEIPDLYEDQQPQQGAEPVIDIPALHTPVLDTPQSDYHSLADYHPTSLCCQDIFPELGAAQCSNSTAPAHITPALSNCKYQPEPPYTTGAPSQGRPRMAEPRRRSYSFDLVDRRAGELPYVIPFDFGLGYGLGSPFSPSPISFPCNPDLKDVHIQPDELASPALSVTAHSNLYLNPSPPGLRRYEALSVWRPKTPSPPFCPESMSDWDDVRSLEQPFPSTASLWVLDPPPPPAVSHSASWPAAREAPQVQRGSEVWSLEEQITIAVLQAMDSRDMSASFGSCSARRLVVRSSSKGKVKRLLGRLWGREVVW